MTDETPHRPRREELLAGALAGDLSGDERHELAELLAHDPAARDELAALGAMAERLPGVGSWVTADGAPRSVADAMAPLPGGADAAVLGTTGVPHPRDPDGDPQRASTRRPPGRGDAGRPRAPRRRNRLLVGVGALGVAAGLAVGLLIPTGPRATEGPPGTLGAVEHVDFVGEPTGVQVEGDLVAHTWGTETLLTIDGLPADAVYQVLVVDRDGVPHDSGTFTGSEVTIVCAMNASPLREDVSRVVIVEGEGGGVVAEADVPPVA